MTTVATAAIPYRSHWLESGPMDSVTTAGATSSATRFITLMSGLIAGPAVSLNGSPTVSPMTVAACASDPFPPCSPSSTSFLALSHAPPAFARNTAMRTPAPMAPPRNPASGATPSPNPTAMGANAASSPGVASSRSASRVQRSTTRPWSGFSVPSMIPGWSANCRRTSRTTAPAERPTALTASRRTGTRPPPRAGRRRGSWAWRSGSPRGWPARRPRAVRSRRPPAGSAR